MDTMMKMTSSQLQKVKKNKMKKKEFNKKGLAISQIFILIFGTLAVSYALGSSIGLVSGLTVNGEFKYNTIDFVIKSQTKIVQKKNPGTQYIKDSSAPCTRTDWFWDVNGNGKWDSAEQDRLDNNLKVCMLPAFVTAMRGAKVPEGEVGLPKGEDEQQPEEEEKESLSLMELAMIGKTLEGLGRGKPSSATEPVSPVGGAAGTVGLRGEIPTGDGVDDVGELVTDTAIAEFLEDKLKFSTSGAIAWGHIIRGAGFALAISAGIEQLKGQLKEWGFSEGQVEALQTGLALAWFAGETTYGLAKAGKLGTKLAQAPGWAGIGVGGAIALVTLFVVLSRKGEQKLVTFECVPWQSKTGGDHCDKCNKQGILPCSEYQCRSLGQGCQLLNEPDSAEALCVWIDRGDSEYPTIRALDSALLEDYSYIPTNKISPPDKGVLISYDEAESTQIIDDKNIGCIPAFTPLRFGITTFDKDNEEGEPAICKIDSVRKNNFDEMNFYMDGSSTFKYNHTQTLSLPGPDALAEEGIEITSEGGIQEFYIRCQDANGNSNPATFVFKFCVDEGPDETPPEIVTTDLINNMPFAYGQDSIDINVYINEPVPENNGCRWSHSDQPYENMENDMDCSQGNTLTDMNAQGLFTCATNLDGLKDGVKNRFYFRCQDLQGNTNKDSYEFILLGTQPLVIDSVSPNEITVKDSTSPVKVTIEVKTSAGYKEGEATCYYKKGDEEEKDYEQFSETISYQHSHELWLLGEPGGKSYTYDIKCIDLGGNADSSAISFEVETDIEAPVVVRVYHEDTYLKIITNEKAECVYDVKNCNYVFDEGLPMASTDDGISHFTDWNTKLNFYIKCRDDYEREPIPPNTCSIIARPLQIL